MEARPAEGMATVSINNGESEKFIEGDRFFDLRDVDIGVE